ncbi:MAG: response regulator, partial [Desulfatiglans sp.]|nr:response regulator [Desulfatiglans sp.]
MELKYKHNILIVDDESSILKSIQRLLRDNKINVLSASNVKEALERLAKYNGNLSLIISDQRMPGMTGIELFQNIKNKFPETIRFLLTGFADVEVLTAAINKGEIHRFIAKPWEDKDLRDLIYQALEQYELTLENKRLSLLVEKQNNELTELNKGLEKQVEIRSKEIIQKNKELESNFFNTIRAFTSIAEMNKPVIAGHGRRVAVIAKDISREMNLSKKEVIQVEIAGLLHDIGKIGLPDSVLEYHTKKLSQQEENLLKKHPEEGQNIVRFINHLDNVGLIIRSHHERYDGLGYPDRLKEEAIPLGARIIAVADAYDKTVNIEAKKQFILHDYIEERELTHDYLDDEELIHKAALYHLKKYAFTHFDPDVVKVFLSIAK